jgi:hypothetical protein
MQDKYYYITLKTVLGYVANWAIQQSPYTVPDNLASVLEELSRRSFPYFQDGVSCCMIWRVNRPIFEQYLRTQFLSIAQVQLWGRPKLDPKMDLIIVSRYGGPPPDQDCINLDALVGNIVRDIFSLMERPHLEENRPDTGTVSNPD